MQNTNLSPKPQYVQSEKPESESYSPSFIDPLLGMFDMQGYEEEQLQMRRKRKKRYMKQ